VATNLTSVVHRELLGNIRYLCGGDLQETFGFTPFILELALSINFVTFGLFCLVAGALDDRFKRRSVVLYSLCVFIFGSLLCTFFDNFILILI
tara:strand:+ start:16320 stop:16598 length:279 start_codon:yes stop_codon:yes gene_type:complete